MRYLVFSAFDVGGWPRAMTEVLNRNGVETYYVSVSRARGHDSAAFHGRPDTPWDLSDLIGRVTRTHDLRTLLERIRPSGCLATGIGANVLRRLGVDYNYWSYGSDLDAGCFWPSTPPKHSPRAWLRYAYRLALIRRARSTVRAAMAVMIAPYQRTSLREVAPGMKLFFLPHVQRTQPFDELEARRREIRPRLLARFDATHLFFSATRHYASTGSRDDARGNDDKGLDVVLQAFRTFRSSVPRTARPKLAFVRKGPDVNRTAATAAQLGLERDLVWLNEMPRSELTELYLSADACLGQFGKPVLTYSAIEPLAQGTPTASYITDPAHETPFYRTLPPVCSSRRTGVIARFLSRASSGDGQAQRMRRESWEWLQSNCSERAFCEAFVDQIGAHRKEARTWAS